MTKTVINEFKFKLIRVEDGGASHYDFDNKDDLVCWMHENGNWYWKLDIKEVQLKDWRPGRCMEFSWGWIFCVI